MKMCTVRLYVRAGSSVRPGDGDVDGFIDHPLGCADVVRMRLPVTCTHGRPVRAFVRYDVHVMACRGVTNIQPEFIWYSVKKISNFALENSKINYNCDLKGSHLTHYQLCGGSHKP
jgi:hypothetical protein